MRLDFVFLNETQIELEEWLKAEHELAVSNHETIQCSTNLIRQKYSFLRI